MLAASSVRDDPCSHFKERKFQNHMKMQPMHPQRSGMYAWHFSRLAILCAAVGSWVLGCAHGPPKRVLIEHLVDQESVSNVLEPKVELSSQFTRTDEVQSFIAEYPFQRRTPDEHYTIQVSVAPPSHFLDPIQYEARRSAVQRAGTPIEAEFPAIGLRAQWEILGMGPGGAAYGLAFTTKDGRHDIRITVSNLLPEGIAEPTLDIEAFARGIEARYNAGSTSVPEARTWAP